MNSNSYNINNSEIETLIMNKNNILKEINSHYLNIKELNNKIELIEKKIMTNCIHEWMRDNTYTGEHSQYQCKKCKLYK